MRDGAPGCCARSAFWRETILPETLSATALLAGNVPSHALVVPEPSDAGTPGFGWSSPSPSQSSGGNHIESRAQRAASKRRAASEWIGMALGVSVPHETDQAFRRALADGVTLCRLVNWLRPGSIPKVVEAMPDGSGTPSHATGDVIQTFENVTNFIRVARDLTGETFSARDLEEGGEERPGVAGCILGLRDLAAGRTPPGPRSSPGPWSTPGGQGLPPLPSPASGARASAGAGPGQAAPRPTPPPRPGFSFTPAAAQLVAKHGLAAAAADAPDGLNHLMRSCTHMLRSRMGLGASSPAPDAGPRRGDEAEAGSTQAPVPAYALDAVGPVLESRAADARYAIRVQLLEINNETLRDLLVEGAAAGGQARSLALNNTARSGVNVPDATQVTVECTEDVLRVMELGARNRAVAETRMNERSSRSHQVLTILVEGEGLNTRARTHACLHLIDLAGSERIGKSGAEGQQLVEAQHINKSLSALGNVMHALASKSAHIPFRDSKLTQLLQDSLAGQAKTMMFVHVAPEASSLSETLSTLNFGKGVTEITLGAARKNTEPGAVFEARDAAGRHEREAAAARVALAERSARCQELEGEVEALHLALAAANRMAAEGRAAAAAERSGGEGAGGIPAFRPATGEAPAGCRAAEAGPGAAPVLAGEPGSAPVPSAAPGPARTAASAPPPPEGLGKAAAGRMLPAMAKLNLGGLIEGEGSPASQASGRSPLLAGAGSRVSRIPGLTPPPATARPARSSPSSTSSIPRPMSARGQSGESRRASLTGDGGPGPLPSSRLSSGQSVAPRVDTGRGAGVRAAPADAGLEGFEAKGRTRRLTHAVAADVASVESLPGP
ncbi:hypothetical protein APUTEX25_003663 [Auxenochlorella protothecoides]|uniref:Kinesin-4 n=1 Tax=Auxenochlorella protothecoides TaxID=3075 RepID=A0A3M7KRX0_AUXPR|nr:hypothetical protein APUTEX25_003663 [Auxenochlorella protothecoides]|eukprot:RMZ52520.1 hypothetical protein APUTEX25_003663 [Auxenochlorella protothecoides]